MAGLNIDSVRNLNKINIYAVKNKNYDTSGKVKKTTKNASSHIFSAYLTKPLGRFDANTQVGSITDEIRKAISGLGIVGDIASSKIGSAILSAAKSNYGHLLGTGFNWSNAAGINYNLNHYFKGTVDFSHQFDCELVIKDDFISDIIIPLWNLLSYVLPDESEPLEKTSVFQLITGGMVKYYNDAKNSINAKNVENPFIEQDWLDKAWTYIETLGGEIGDMAGGCTIIMKPKQLQGGMSHTRITIGDYIEIDDVIIESVNFELPYLLYEGGLFDKVNVGIKVKGNRKLTLKTYDWIRRLVMSNVDMTDVELMKPQPVSSLNSMFKPTIIPKQTKP